MAQGLFGPVYLGMAGHARGGNGAQRATGSGNGVRESAGQSRQGVADERAAWKRSSDLPRTVLPIERIDETVAAHYGVMPADLGSWRACGGAAKFVAVEIACRLTGLTQRAIGAHYGAISSAAVSNIRRRLRQGEYTLSDVVAQLYQQIIPVSS